MALTWTWYPWDELGVDRLYDCLRLRSDIFVVEQQCVFADIDGLDPRCLHLCGEDPQQGLLAYLRLLPPALKSPPPALGRLVVRREARGRGLAKAAIAEGLARCAACYPGQAIFLSSQQHLAALYRGFGFQTTGAPYLDDGIWHLDMLRPPG